LYSDIYLVHYFIQSWLKAWLLGGSCFVDGGKWLRGRRSCQRHRARPEPELSLGPQAQVPASSSRDSDRNRYGELGDQAQAEGP
jgi:hypothetical protein